MSKMFYLFGKQYKGLIGHLIFIWLTIIIASVAILAVYYTEKKIEKKVNDRLSSSLILYLTPNTDTERLIQDLLMKYKIINKFSLITGLESIVKLEKEFDLSNLQKWVMPENLSDYIVLTIKGEEFSLKEFLQMIDRFSNDPRIASVDYNKSEINRLGKIKSLLYQYKYYPFFIIIFVASFQLFLFRRLIRNRQKEKWKLWKQKGYKHLYKIPHLLIETVILFLVISLSLLIPIYFLQDKIYQLFDIQVLELNLGWYGVFCLLGVYIFISLINLISKDEPKG